MQAYFYCDLSRVGKKKGVGRKAQQRSKSELGNRNGGGRDDGDGEERKWANVAMMDKDKRWSGFG